MHIRKTNGQINNSFTLYDGILISNYQPSTSPISSASSDPSTPYKNNIPIFKYTFGTSRCIYKYKRPKRHFRHLEPEKIELLKNTLHLKKISKKELLQLAYDTGLTVSQCKSWRYNHALPKPITNPKTNAPKEESYQSNKRFSTMQSIILNNFFNTCSMYPNDSNFEQLANETKLSLRQCRQWFANKRKRELVSIETPDMMPPDITTPNKVPTDLM